MRRVEECVSAVSTQVLLQQTCWSPSEWVEPRALTRTYTHTPLCMGTNPLSLRLLPMPLKLWEIVSRPCLRVCAWECTLDTCASRGRGRGCKLLCMGSRERPFPRWRWELLLKTGAVRTWGSVIVRCLARIQRAFLNEYQACIWVANASNTHEAAMSFSYLHLQTGVLQPVPKRCGFFNRA